MPPVLAMPIIRPKPGTGYSDSQHQIALGLVRVVPGATDMRDGLEIDVNDVAETAPERIVYAMVKGHVAFSYVTRQSSGPSATGPQPTLRAVLMLDPSIHQGDLRARSRHQLEAVHPEESLGRVNEGFRALTYIEYENLDLLKTKEAVLQLVRWAQANSTESAAQWILSSCRPSRPAQQLGRWLERSGNTPEGFVEELFSHRRLNRLVRDPLAMRAVPTTGLHVSAGDEFAALAIAPDSPTDTPTFNYRLMLRFFDEAKQLANPCFFFNALVKRKDRVDFFDDAKYAEAVGGGLSDPNKLGITELLSSSPDPALFFPPDPLARRLHPVMWAFTLGDHGVFTRTGSGPLRAAAAPSFFVASASPPVYHPDYDRHRIDLHATGLGQFHVNQRRVTASSTGFSTDPIAAAALDSADPTLLRGGAYLWRIDDDGYLVYRTNSTVHIEDDWYQPFTASDLRSVTRIWELQGADISRFSLYFGLPCELFVGVAAKEGGSDGETSVGLEPWFAPPGGYVGTMPWTDRAALETVPPEDILSSHMSDPGIKYLLMTQVWNPDANRWQGMNGMGGTRRGERYVRGGRIEFGIRYGRVVKVGDGERLILTPEADIPETIRSVQIQYTWEELLNDLDHFGNKSAASQPPEARKRSSRTAAENAAGIPSDRYRDSRRFAATLDQRISPGPTQNIIAFVPGEAAIRRALEVMNGAAGANTILTELRDSGFFNQTHDYLGETKNILDPETPPSYRFLWLMNGGHNSLITFVRWMNTLRDIGPTSSSALHGILQPDNDRSSPRHGEPDYNTFDYRLENDVRDPVIVVTIHGGKDDLKRFNSVATFGIYLIGRSRLRWRTMPPKFNACVHLFEQFDKFGTGGLPLPGVRFARRRT